MELEKGFNSWRKKSSRQGLWPENQTRRVVCGLCTTPIRNASEAAFTQHVKSEHAGVLDEKTEEEEKTDLIRSLWETARAAAAKGDGSKPRDGSGGSQVAVPSPSNESPGDMGNVTQPTPQPPPEAPTSPASSLKREGSRSQSPSKRSKAPPAEETANFDPRPRQIGTLWTPRDEPPRPSRPDKSNVAPQQRLRVSSSSSHARAPPRPGPAGPGSAAQRSQSNSVEDQTSVLVKQPETRPISGEQLVAEVKGIYAGLVMVESKCIEVDNAQNAQNDSASKLNNEQWQALIALHRTLLHEHHDFFLASQHPSASPALRRLASKYAMPARMWRHGIHSFLELLRHRLPSSLEHMLTFIYLAYSMMALLYETVPTFEDTWIECLGDLGRYRMAIEDDNIHDRENWTLVSRQWYSKASDKAPTTGRLYHHLAILARPNALQQLYYYVKSLCVAVPFESARESIMTLLDPVMAMNPDQKSRLPKNELAFVRCIGIMFSKKFTEKLDSSVAEFISSLDIHIARKTAMFPESGYHMGITICCSILGFGDAKNPVYTAVKYPDTEESVDQPMVESAAAESPLPKQLADALSLANKMHDVVLRRFGDPNILSFLHVILVFLGRITKHPEAMKHVGAEFPWKLLSLMLNTLLADCQSYSRIESESFPQQRKGERPLPEDWAMRGLLWTESSLPSSLFTSEEADDSERYFEAPSMIEQRKERVLFFACRIAAQGGDFLLYDSTSHRFSVPAQFEFEIPGITCDAEPTPETETAATDLEMADIA